MGIKRTKGSIQRGKKPILINHLKAIINVINEEKIEEIKKIRDKSIILVGFGGGFRRTELISIDYEDIEFVPEGVKNNTQEIKNRSIWRRNDKRPTLLCQQNILSGKPPKKMDRNIQYKRWSNF